MAPEMSTGKDDGDAPALAPGDSRLRFAELLMQSPVPILVMTGPEHRMDMLNPPYVQLLRRNDASELLGRPIRKALPELEGQQFFALLDHVFATGESYVGKEVLCKLRSEAEAEQALAELADEIAAEAARQGSVWDMLRSRVVRAELTVGTWSFPV